MALVGFYGDDFTGSIDALLQFRRAGLSGVLLTDSNDVASVADRDVIGIAGISRSLPTADLDPEVSPALARLRDLRPEVVQYKACSTVDSSPEVGSIGRVLEIASRLFPPLPVPMIFAQPDFGRYTIFGQHFATDGERTYRLDRHPTMASHPTTPISEADLARLIGGQTELAIGSIPWTRFDDQKQLATMINSATEAAVVCDAFTDKHLVAVAEAALAEPTRPRFMIGSGGLSLGLGLALRQAQGPKTDECAQGTGLMAPGLSPSKPVAPAADRTLALSGSYSRRTRDQIDAAVRAGWQALDLFEPDASAKAAKLHRSGVAVVVHSLAAEDRSEQIAARLAEVADACLAVVPNTRMISCGGDTSGSLLRRLGVRELIIEAEPWGNVALCRTGGGRTGEERSFEVILKGGQMGHLDLLEDIRHGRAV